MIFTFTRLNGTTEFFMRTRAVFAASFIAGWCLFWATGSAVFAEDVIGIQKDIDALTFDPHDRFSRSPAEVLPLLTDTLVAMKPDLRTVEPGLATSWQISSDRLTYRFNLRTDVKFCNGRPMTAADVVATFERWMDPKRVSSNRSVYGPLSTVTMVDAKTVEFRLSAPFFSFLERLSAPYSGIIDVEMADKLGKDFGVTAFNGTGPYCWDYWKPRQEMSLKRHAAYKWGPAQYANRGPALVDRVVFRIRPEDNSRVSAMLAGQDEISYVLPASEIASFRSNPRFSAVPVRPSTSLATIIMRTNRPVISELAVRKAINMAIDRKAIVETIWAGEVEAAPFVLQSTHSPAVAAIVKKLPSFSVAAANELLDKSGWVRQSDGMRAKGGKKLALLLVGANNFREVAEAIQGMLRKIGMDVQVSLADTPVSTTRILQKDDFDMFIYHIPTNTAEDLMNRMFNLTSGLAPYRHVPAEGVEIDKAFKSLESARSQKEADAAEAKAFQLFADGFFAAPLYQRSMTIIYNKNKVTGIKSSAFGGSALYKGLDLKVIK